MLCLIMFGIVDDLGVCVIKWLRFCLVMTTAFGDTSSFVAVNLCVYVVWSIVFDL